MAGPVGPACIVGKLRIDGLADPGAHTAAGMLKCRSQLSYHQRVGDKVQHEHQNPAENNLDSVKVYEAVQNVSKAPDCGKRHEGQGIPVDFL